jgi:hypothetical protein
MSLVHAKTVPLVPVEAIGAETAEIVGSAGSADRVVEPNPLRGTSTLTGWSSRSICARLVVKGFF